MKYISYVFCTTVVISWGLGQVHTAEAAASTTSFISTAPSVIVASSTFIRNLTIGSSGNDVQILQKYLNVSGYLIASSGVGSIGNETKSFGVRTKNALAKFQFDHRILPAAGFFGLVTRATLLKLALAQKPSLGAGGSGAGGSSLHGQGPYILNYEPSFSSSSGVSVAATTSASSTLASSTSSVVAVIIPPISTIARDLSYGATGPDVLTLQLFLISLGYPIASTTAVFDAPTISALVDFQYDHSLPASGYFGALTFAVMNAIQNGTYVPPQDVNVTQIDPITKTPILIQGR
jgi:peptidoglycan hydrolase-like protein with peptidoglycan-binding domain